MAEVRSISPWSNNRSCGSNKEDFDQGMAQNCIRLLKRKHDEIESDSADNAYGIVTDG
ncbi:9293_t:CDS:2 [Paraglomus occultum]|uniref:9293_t:CDS:1 n=1 Tax=Paraglomus occultum TaxID=144539 RepID=A0A9N9H7W9_9GLOM|nr:9293_t:CDS:2 [Paraglomus occultum]